MTHTQSSYPFIFHIYASETTFADQTHSLSFFHSSI